MAISISRLDTGDFGEARPDILDVYRKAFSQPPYNEGEGGVLRFAASLDRQAGREGFKCVVARPGDGQPIVGFAFGFTATPGQWWRDTVAGALDSIQGSHWLMDCFELAELALTPAYQGKGIGGRLHDSLLAGLPHQTALLSTIAAETNALHLYRKRGWITLVDHLTFPGGVRTYRIMGLDLLPFNARRSSRNGDQDRTDPWLSP